MKTPTPDKPDKPTPDGNVNGDGHHSKTNGTDGDSKTDKSLPKTGDADSTLTVMIGILLLMAGGGLAVASRKKQRKG